MSDNYLKIELYNQMKEEVISLSDQYEKVFNGTQDAMFLIDVDSDLRTTYKRLNKSHERLTGLTTEMVAGKSPTELLGKEIGGILEANYMKCIMEMAPITYEEELTLGSGTKTWLTTLSPVIKDDRVIHIVGASRDITEIKRTQEKVQEEKEKLDIILQSIWDGVISLSSNNKINFINSSAEIIMDCSKEDAIGRDIKDFLTILEGNNVFDIENFLHAVEASEKPVELMNDSVLISRSLAMKRISGKGTKVKNATGRVQGIVITIKDETEKLKNEEKIAYLSIHDSLTGLYNRAFFDAELERLDSSMQPPLSIIVGDANGLKLSNDVFGHAEGDKLLISIANILKDSCRNEDIVSRWGGDEFSIILPHTSYENALMVCRRIKEKCENSEASPIKPSIALGVATKTNEAQNISRIIAEAEADMYKNKLTEGRKVRSEIVSMLRDTLQERSNETIEHCNRMQMLAHKIMSDFHLSEKEGEALKLLANIHDIGNVTVCRDIFLKPGRLDEWEWTEVKRHSEAGYRIAQSTAELVHIADLILAHHENWDGSGYPEGLSEKQIPKLSRILTLMDAYDTITHDRSYRKAASHEEAVNEIRRCTGTQFDPALSEIFISAVNRITA